MNYYHGIQVARAELEANMFLKLDKGDCYFQKTWFYNNSPLNGLSSHLNLLEAFNPNKLDDADRWIPTGLYYDLIDDQNDNDASPRRVPVIDIVSGYTNQYFFNALDDDITSLPAYKVRLLNENNNWQSTGVTSIFSFYGY